MVDAAMIAKRPELNALLHKLALVCLLCLSVSSADAQTARDHAIGLLIDELRNAGYSDVAATQRLMGGYVVEARKGSEALVIALDGFRFFVLDAQAYAAEGNGVAGLFPTRTSVSETAQEVLDRYSARIAANPERPANAEVAALLREGLSAGYTAGFSQSRTISTAGDTAVVRQTETLGMLSPFFSLVETSASSDGKNSHSINQTASYSRNEATGIVSISGGSGFAQQVFSDPQGFRDSISVAPVVQQPVLAPILPPALQQVDRNQIINGVVSSIEGMLSQLPFEGRPSLPADLRERITSLHPAP